MLGKCSYCIENSKFVNNNNRDIFKIFWYVKYGNY